MHSSHIAMWWLCDKFELNKSLITQWRSLADYSSKVVDVQVPRFPIWENKSVARDGPGAHANARLCVEEHSPLSERVAWSAQRHDGIRVARDVPISDEQSVFVKQEAPRRGEFDARQQFEAHSRRTGTIRSFLPSSTHVLQTAISATERSITLIIVLKRCTSSHSLALRRSDTSQNTRSPLPSLRATTRSSSVPVCESNATPHTALSRKTVGSCAASCSVGNDTARSPAAPHVSSTSSAESALRLHIFRYSLSERFRFHLEMRVQT